MLAGIVNDLAFAQVRPRGHRDIFADTVYVPQALDGPSGDAGSSGMTGTRRAAGRSCD
jgi:hypothetical protein